MVDHVACPVQVRVYTLHTVTNEVSAISAYARRVGRLSARLPMQGHLTHRCRNRSSSRMTSCGQFFFEIQLAYQLIGSPLLDNSTPTVTSLPTIEGRTGNAHLLPYFPNRHTDLHLKQHDSNHFNKCYMKPARVFHDCLLRLPGKELWLSFAIRAERITIGDRSRLPADSLGAPPSPATNTAKPLITRKVVRTSLLSSGN